MSKLGFQNWAWRTVSRKFLGVGSCPSVPRNDCTKDLVVQQ